MAKDKVLRDYIQNFYDSIGPKNFHKDFQVWEKDVLLLQEGLTV